MSLRILTGLKRYITVNFLIIILGLSLLESVTIFCQSRFSSVSSQEKELKRDSVIKYIRNYSRKEYKNKSQNWAALQDKRGMIYVANQGGLLEFDGVSWREIRVPNITVRSLAIDNKGTIYVGGINEIGFLSHDSKGALNYVSLMAHLDKSYRNFSNVWRTHATKKGIYFCTSKFLFFWDFKKIICKAKTKNFFAAPFLIKGELYVRQNGVGLQEMKKDSLELVPGGEAFSTTSIYMLTGYDPGKLLIGTGSEDFYLYDKGKKTPLEKFKTDAVNYIKNKKLSFGLRLSSGDFALATFKGGVVIIGPEGSVKNIFNKDSGLQDDDVKYIFEDSAGNLWLCLGEGISKVECASPISVYDDRYDLPGNVLSVVRHQGTLYAGTTRGLYFLESSSSFSSPGKFRALPGIPGCCWFLLSTADSLLAATDKGIFQIGNNKIKNITSPRSFALYRSWRDSNRTWVGTNQGLVSLYFNRENRQWTEEYKFGNINQEIITIVEDTKGNLWLGTRATGVLKIDFPSAGTMTHPDVTTYDSSHGLPSGEANVFMAAGHVMFATGKGIFRFDEAKKIFLPDVTLGYELAGGENGRGVFRILEDKKKNIWVHSISRNIQAIPQSDGTFLLNKKPFLRIPLAQVNTIYPDPYEETIWFASADGLIGYNTNLQKDYDLLFHSLIREVVVNGMPLFYDAEAFKYQERKGGCWKDKFPVFPYKDRNLGFHFAAPFFEGESETMYQFLLEGYDNDWSVWTKENKKDYTNLDPGLHTFRVRAKNLYENLSKEDVFQFKILPPWYKTWWAFSVYGVTALLVMYLVVKWRSWKLVWEKQRLEEIIKDRTKEINRKNQQLEEKSEKLKEMDQVKSRFFANISHEFRTPLTLIMGPLEQMLADCPDEKQQMKLKLMLRNSQRLLALINQLLELSKFDSGKVKLKASRQNMIPFLKGITSSFEILALQHELDLTFHAENDEDIQLYIDPQKIEDVMCNLLLNAVKFTPAGGKITVTVKKNPVKEAEFPSGSLDTAVCDTGPGIPREQLANIFDRFYQSEITYEHHRKGSGIGLAIAKELVELHHGKIKANSREGEGTEFIIRLPMGDFHLKPDEIVRSAKKPYQQKKTGELPSFHMMEDEAGAPAEVKPGNIEDEKDIILVVEDSADVRKYIRGALEPSYLVLEAANGREGIQQAQEIIPDLIISDIMMPETDGYELCKVLKTDVKTSHVPIVLLTAKAAEENIIEGLETGADDYITKPFNTKILLTRIKNLIDLRRHLQEKIQREMVLQPTEIAVSSLDREFMKELKTAIEKNLSEAEFSVDELAKILYISRASLNRKIRAIAGESTNNFIQSYRLKKAAQLLKAKFGNVTDVAFEVGFSSSAYFTKCFKEKFHQLPHTYMNSDSGLL